MWFMAGLTDTVSSIPDGWPPKKTALYALSKKKLIFFSKS